MKLSNGEKFKIIMNRQGCTVTKLADDLGTTRQNLTNKFKRDNFDEKETRAIAAALGCEVETVFTLPDGSTL